MNNIFILFLMILFMPSLIKLFKSISFFIYSFKESKRSYSLSEILNRLTFKEFRLWCIDYLLSLEYQDIMFTTAELSDLICKKCGKIYLVRCLRPKKELSIQDVQLLIGTMVAENIYNGVIITTSRVSPYIYEYIDNLSYILSINIIDKEDLKHEYDENNGAILE